MSLTVALKADGQVYLASNSSNHDKSFNLPLDPALNFHSLFKVNDVFISFHGADLVLKAAYFGIDLAKLTKPLSRRMIYENFFLPLVQKVKAERLLPLNGNGTITDYQLEAIFTDGDKIFLFNGSAIYEEYQASFIGSQAALGIRAADYVDETNALTKEETAVQAVKTAIHFSDDTAYPILLASTSSSELTVIDQEGKRTQCEIPIWKGQVKA
jgi:hypothetical protein